jgi:serine/threonine protein phosphatase 1
VHLAARDDLLERLPVAHLRFLEDLELMVGVGDYAFVHAGVRPGVALARQAENDLLWIREEFLEAEVPHDRIIVHGHTWDSDQPQVRANRIGIDTGAYETGVLTALRLEDDSLSVLAAR